MLVNFRPLTLLLCAAVMFGAIGACSPAHYKEEADKEVYKIIDKKWKDDFGQKVNYTISDVVPSPNDLQIEKDVPSGVINLAEAAAIATAHNRDYQKQKEELYLIALDLTLERHQFVMQWFGTFDPKYTRGHSSSSAAGDDNEEVISYAAEGGFSQLLADGALISASIALDWARFLTGDPRASIGSVLSATITQPLLRGAGRRIAQENLTQAERNVLYEIRSFNRYRQEFIVSIVSDYYRVLQRRDAVANAENDYKLRVESRERLEMQADAGRVNRFEVDQAKQRELDAMNSYVRVQQSYQQALDEFKIRLALPTDADIELDQNELKALVEMGVRQPDYTVDAAIETSLLSRLDLATSMDKIDDSLRKVMVAENGLGADLNLVGSMNVGSTGQTDYSRLQFHQGIYGLGLEADLPLDRKRERNVYREALIALTQQQRQYENDADIVKLQVRQAYRDLEQAAESYRIQKNSLELAQTRVDSTTLLLEAGRLTTRDLLEAQDALLQAQNSLTAALVDHAIAKLSFFRDIGILQVRPDGMWIQ
ncbi:MAG: TolC family protein [Sedimentisphaerales bacterium]|nr:TolC family protein [Sedimentisphaerales bacterium]